mgnify:CR=1 FL=1
MRKFKILVERDGKHVVEEGHGDLNELVKRLLSKPRKGLVWEWIFSYESPLVKPLMGQTFVQWVFGASAKELGLIHICIDTIGKEFTFLGYGDEIDYLTGAFSLHSIHELIHCLEPQLTEAQVGYAVSGLVKEMLK